METIILQVFCISVVGNCSSNVRVRIDRNLKGINTVRVVLREQVIGTLDALTQRSFEWVFFAKVSQKCK